MTSISALLGPVLLGTVLLGPAPGRQRGTVPTVETLVERVANTWDPLRATLRARMTVIRAGRPPSAFELLIRRGGRGRTRIDFLSPANDEGKVVLSIGKQAWLYLPRADRVVELPARRNPLAGGVLFEDLSLGAAETTGAFVEQTDDAFVLAASGSKGAKKASNRVYFDKSTLLPVRREVYAPSGRLLKTVYIDETRAWHAVEIPWKVRFVDHLEHGTETHIDILKAEELGDDVEALFSRDRLKQVPGAGASNGR